MSRTVQQWRDYLSQYSAEVLRVDPEEELTEVSDAQRASRWLGFEGASEEQLAEAERRLGVTLPPGYRSFLAASDGWVNISKFMWTMRTTADVGWLHDIDPEMWQILEEEKQEFGEDGEGTVVGHAVRPATPSDQPRRQTSHAVRPATPSDQPRRQIRHAVGPGASSR